MDVSIRHTSTSRDLRHMEAVVYTRCLKYAQLSGYESIWSIFWEKYKTDKGCTSGLEYQI